MNANFQNTSKSINMKFLSFSKIVIIIYLININVQVMAWGYPEDNCYNCFEDTTWGKDSMYYCRHNSSGLIWGQCCRRDTSSSHECKEMYDSSKKMETRCSDRTPLSIDMQYYYCLVDKDDGMKRCGRPHRESSYHLAP